MIESYNPVIPVHIACWLGEYTCSIMAVWRHLSIYHVTYHVVN